MKKITSVLLLSSLWLTMSVLSTAATDIPVEIPCPVAVAPSSEYQYDPTLNAAGDVVWLEYDPVTGYDQVFSNWAGQLTFDEWNHESASLNSRRDVIWEWFDEAANFWRISGIIEDLPVNLYEGHGPFLPAINDVGTIAFINEASEIELLPGGPVTSDGSWKTSVDINNNGDLVWDRYDDDHYSQIYYLQNGTAEPIQITSEHYDHMFPTISNAGEIAWEDDGFYPSPIQIVSSLRGSLTSDTCSPGMLFFYPDFDGCGNLVVGGEDESRFSQIYRVDNLGLSDVDGDGIGDACDNGDYDEDGLSDAEEYALGTDPGNPDTDNDSIPDGQDPEPLIAWHFAAPTATLLSATFNGEALVDSHIMGMTQQAVAGDEVAVFDPDGVICGRTQITVDGEFGPLVVYGDDPSTTEVDEGASDGETLTVRLWDSQRQVELPVRTLQLNGSRQLLTWSDGGGATVALQGLAQSHVGVFRPSTVRWYADADGNGLWGGLDYILSGFGMGTDKVAAGDWNGDGITDPGVFRAVGNFGWWYFDSNGSGQWESGIDQGLQFGYGTDTPVVGDWNGDGQSDFGVFRNKNGQGWWYFDSNGNRQWDSGVDQSLQFGLAGDIPVVGDWNGDGISDFGAVRFKNGLAYWYFDSNGNRLWDSGVDQSIQFGIEGDIPVVGDWNGDGLSDFGVMRNGIWYLDSNGNRQWDSGVDLVYPAYGLPGDQPMGGVWR